MQRQKYRQLRQDRHLYYFVSWVHVASNVEPFSEGMLQTSTPPLCGGTAGGEARKHTHLGRRHRVENEVSTFES
jgi:hypothetical protein